jgi:hypothetical protein
MMLEKSLVTRRLHFFGAASFGVAARGPVREASDI